MVIVFIVFLLLFPIFLSFDVFRLFIGASRSGEGINASKKSLNVTTKTGSGTEHKMMNYVHVPVTENYDFVTDLPATTKRQTKTSETS